MEKKKLGIGSIEINAQFESEEIAYKYANRLKEFIRYNCIKKKYMAQAIIGISNLVGEVCSVKYVNDGKVGRPRKEMCVSELRDSYYKVNYERDWHLHILIVSMPSYSFRDDIKSYIDKNWQLGKITIVVVKI